MKVLVLVLLLCRILIHAPLIPPLMLLLLIPPLPPFSTTNRPWKCTSLFMEPSLLFCFGNELSSFYTIHPLMFVCNVLLYFIIILPFQSSKFVPFIHGTCLLFLFEYINSEWHKNAKYMNMFYACSLYPTYFLRNIVGYPNVTISFYLTNTYLTYWFLNSSL